MSLEKIASSIGAKDLFILRKVSEEKLFNIDGFGRGAGWAGNVSLDRSQEPFVSKVLAEDSAVRRSGVPFRAFGPYWTKEIAGVALQDVVVLIGGEGVSALAPEAVREAAGEALAVSTGDVSAEKLDADELEVQQAIDSLLEGADGADVEALARHLASATAQALSCEFGAVLLFDPPMRLFLADEGWLPAASEEETIAALLPLQQVAREGLFVEQDLSASNFPYRPLSFDDGLVARCVVPLGEDGRLGLLVAAHAGTQPRGFTSLCQRVASSMADAGEPLLDAAIARG